MPASFCPSCGTPVENGASYCPNCGAAIPAATSSAQFTTPTQPNQTYGNAMGNSFASLDQPLNVGQFVGVMLLSGIPLVGLILMFVWAFGSDVNTNKKNYARAFLIIAAIGLALSILLSTILATAFATIFSSVGRY